MASYFLTISASDACIAFLRAHPDSISQFVDGIPPTLPVVQVTLWQRIFGRPRSETVPGDWPTQEAMLKAEINHRNVDLFHLLLNGTTDFVEGPGCLFQTWLTTQHQAIVLPIGDDAFAFEAVYLAPLARLFDSVSREATAARFELWMERREKNTKPSETEVEELWKDFRSIGNQVSECARAGRGLVWVSV